MLQRHQAEHGDRVKGLEKGTLSLEEERRPVFFNLRLVGQTCGSPRMQGRRSAGWLDNIVEPENSVSR